VFVEEQDMRTAGLATLGTGRYRAPIYARHDNKLLAIALLEATHVFNVAVYPSMF
jgi:hypothetical protein